MNNKIRLFILLILPGLFLLILFNSGSNFGLAGTKSKKSAAVTSQNRIKKQLKSLGFRKTEITDTPNKIKLKKTDGNRIKFANYAGTWVMVNFWSRRCPHCIREFPELQELWEQFKGENFILIGVNLDASPAVIKQIRRKYRVNFPLVYPGKPAINRRLTNKYKIRLLPTTLLFTPDQNYLYKLLGPREWGAKKVMDRFSYLF